MENSMIEQPEDLYAEPGPDGDECETCGAAAGQDCDPGCPRSRVNEGAPDEELDNNSEGDVRF